jgi:glycosyltransferase involved in cell wall biosynthesis
MQYKLSICIPTYNREKYLKDILDSIVNQLDDTI